MKKLTLDDWITSSGKYPERADSPDLNDKVKANAVDLVARHNALLEDLEWTEDVQYSSGFRPDAVNSQIANAAKNSSHKTGKAGDMQDPDHKLAAAILARPDLLKKHNLMIENPKNTPGWAHTDTAVRPPRASQMFNP